LSNGRPNAPSSTATALSKRRGAERDGTRSTKRRKTVALAFGAGGARGLAQIVAIEAFDERGLEPVALAGTSIGAAVAAAYAAGMSGRAMRRHAIAMAHDRAETFARLIGARASALAALFSVGFANPILLDAEKFCSAFLPLAVPDDFSKLSIPLTVFATDLHARSEVAFASGALKPAIAASMAVPGLVRPVEIDGRVLVDGGAVNPLPFDHLRGRADIIVAIDTSVGRLESRGIPDPWECLFMTLQVMSHTIVAEKLKHGAPDLLLRPPSSAFRLLDFFHASAILRAAEPMRAEIKARLGTLIRA
jgi:NTE family protein